MAKKKKKRLPIEQLREAGEQARKMLAEKGIISKESTIDKLFAEKETPTLPGIPAYLPHQWTLQVAQRMMMDLLILWKQDCKSKNSYNENITEFFKFVVKELRRQEKKFYKEEQLMSKTIKLLDEVPVLKDVFSPTRKKESMHAIQRFFIDSFAVSITLNGSESVSEYANWFLDWTQDLYVLWMKPEKRKDYERT